MTDDRASDRYRDAVLAEVAALEQDIRHRVVDLEEAFGLRDWAAVGRIYREVADVADRLELLDPRSRARQLGRAEARSVSLLERAPAELDLVSDDDPLDEDATLDENGQVHEWSRFGDDGPRWLR